METTDSNLSVFTETIGDLMNGPIGMPAMCVAWGDRATTIQAAAIVAQQHNGLQVRANATWTMAAMLAAIWGEMGGKRLSNRAAMLDGIIKNLSELPRPLVILEADYLLKRQDMFDALYDICELTAQPVIMLGSEDFARKLRATERTARRIPAWVELNATAS